MSARAVAAAAVGLGIVVAVTVPLLRAARSGEVPSFSEQVCSLPDAWLTRTVRGYNPRRSGQIAVLPDKPAYLASGAGGWSHSGPWPYLQRVPLVFYGPGLLPAARTVDRPVTSADVAPTLARLMGGPGRTGVGRVLPEAVPGNEALLRAGPPKLIVVVVLDGGGWNTLEQWPDDWPVLKRLIRNGISYRNATVGSSPSVTPAVHTTLGTGVFPNRHGITGIPVRDERGVVVDSFLKGESARFMTAPALSERWDEANGNKALVAMVGYEPWHLGMIGQGAERPGGDKDAAAWLDIETNRWVTNEDHYNLPKALVETGGLQRDLARLDAADGVKDGAWGEHAILEDRDRIEETPAFVAYHTRAMMNLIEERGYGADSVTDLLWTNYKQIDRLGHYFNMASEEVHEAVVATDEQLAVILRSLDRVVGRGRWLMVVTADHGQQPDAPAIDGYGIDPSEVADDIDQEFGAITRAVWPTEIFLYPDKAEANDVSIADVASFLGDYRLADNTIRPDLRIAGSGVFEPRDRIFQMAIPARLLPRVDCNDR